MSRILVIGVIAIVMAGLALGLSVVGGPGYARMEARDHARLSDLRRFGEFKACELTLSAGPKDCSGLWGAENPMDSDRGAPFTFEQSGEDAFRVCTPIETDPKDWPSYQANGLSVEGQKGCLAYYRNDVNGDWIRR